MPTIRDFGDFRVVMYFGDHNPPHVHVVGPAFSAMMSIQDQSILAGELPRKVESAAITYVSESRSDLMTMWQRYSE